VDSKPMRIILNLLIVLLLNGCVSTSKDNKLPQVVSDYFDTYAKREDFNKFMTYYADNAQFEDIIYGNSFNSKVEISNFLEWNKGEFKILNGNKALTVTRHTFGVNTAITEGFFHTFSYDGQKLGPWLFVITQEFDSNHKIIRQTDWINYTPRVDFLGGKNMNDELVKK
jgi:hypothetical protein